MLKVGSALVTTHDGQLATDVIQDIVRQVVALLPVMDVIIVTSGAAAHGRRLLRDGASAHPRNRHRANVASLAAEGVDPAASDLDDRRVAALLGQSRVTNAWVEEFARLGALAGQILVTDRDLLRGRRPPYLKALSSGIVPVINANDPCVGSLKAKVADNDRLAAHIARETHAEMMVFLTEPDGVLAPDGAALRSVSVAEVNAIKSPNFDSFRGTGGMHSKLTIAGELTRHVEHVVIAGGRVPDVIARIARREDVGTRVVR